MLKIHEEIKPESCFNRADDHEYLFVLMGRDIAAPSTILFWITERVRLGKNKVSDAQIVEAFECAKAMESQSKPPSV